MQVTASLPDGAPVLVGQMITFNIILINNSTEDVIVLLTDDEQTWTKELSANANSKESYKLEHEVPNTTPSGSLLVFSFQGKVGEENIRKVGTDKFIYNVPVAENIEFDIHLGPESKQIPGGLLVYYVTVTNKGENNIYNIRIHQSLDPEMFNSIDVLQPGQSLLKKMEFTIPLSTPIGQDVSNIFTVTADGSSAITAESKYNIPVNNTLSLSVVTKPNNYSKGSLIEIEVTAENKSSYDMGEVYIRNKTDSRIIPELGAGQKSAVIFIN